MIYHTGSIEVITGSMFSGKTDELIRRLRRATIARQKVQVFKPAIDNRYNGEKVTSHAGSDYDALAIHQAAKLLECLNEDTTVVAIDEAQFFGAEISEIAQKLADRGLRVIVAGLDTDFRGEPFGPMPVLMAQAEIVDKLHAICMICGEPRPAPNGWSTENPLITMTGGDVGASSCRSALRMHHEVPRADMQDS
jgi:thymidine kinase